MNLLIEQSFDPRHNLAREELLLSKADTDTLYLWRNRPSVIIGRNQNTLAEVDEEAARKEDIRIVRRLGVAWARRRSGAVSRTAATVAPACWYWAATR